MQKIIAALKNAKNVMIFPHVRSDGDAVASSLAMGRLLNSFGVPYTMYIEDSLPPEMEFLGGDFRMYTGEEACTDTAVALDCGDTLRIGRRAALYERAAVRINIDHHITNDHYGDINFVDPAASATSEIMARLFKEAGAVIDAETAKILFTGIATDTGGFRFSNASAKTHRVVAELMDAGADGGRLCHLLFEQDPIEKIRLQADVIENVQILHEGRTAISTLSVRQIESRGACDADAANLSSVLRAIRGVEAAVLLRETEEGIKISMRTSEMVDAAAICASYGGGGHARAAGATVQGTLSEWAEKLAATIGEVYGRHS